MSMDVQRQIRENTLELNEFLKDLKGWEKTVKQKERSIQSQLRSNDKLSAGAPKRQPSSAIKEKDVQEKTREKPEVKGIPSGVKDQTEVKKQVEVSSKSGSTAAGHTYDHFRNKWDKFDVDVALKEIDEDEEDGPVKKESKEIFRPCGPQSNIDKRSEGPRKAASVSYSSPPGNILGGDDHPMTTFGRLSESYGFDESPPDAASEKDLGNEYFKEGKYVRAIDCYSRSIALQPTAVAYANRAMAAIKIKRFEDAELDCSEAISLDDRYTKAYARRGTARKGLKKYLPAVKDFEFALRLEPGNKELLKQYTEAEELYQKERGQRQPEEVVPPIVKKKKEEILSSQQLEVQLKSTPATVDVIPKAASSPELLSTSTSNRSSHGDLAADANSVGTKSRPSTNGDMLPSTRISVPDATPTREVGEKQVIVKERKIAEVAAATQAAADRAAASAMAAVSRNIVAPRSSYEFELMWKGFGGNESSQARLLKVMDPLTLPKVFKDSLSAPLLVEIIQTLELLFPEDANFAIQILENLTKVGRFNMTVMFLTSKEKTRLGQLWERVSMKSPQELQTQLQALRAAYRLV